MVSREFRINNYHPVQGFHPTHPYIFIYPPHSNTETYELTVANRCEGAARTHLNGHHAIAHTAPPLKDHLKILRNDKITQYDKEYENSTDVPTTSLEPLTKQTFTVSNLPLSVPRKRKYSNQTELSFDVVSCEGNGTTDSPATNIPTAPSSVASHKKSSHGTSSLYDDEGEDAKSIRTQSDKKQSHCEIEKRRRDKMNTYISELSSLVPMCSAMERKLDKLTVLRMAVQHLRSVRGSISTCALSARPRPSYLPENELNSLILQVAQNCFLLVVGCDRGRLLYVSASVKEILNYEQSELLGQSLFDILHPKDVAKVKEQLSSSDLSPRERFIDAKTMLPVKADVVSGDTRFCLGARRSFFCRIKCNMPSVTSPSDVSVKTEADGGKLRKKPSHERKYCVVQCTGYLKSWAPATLTDGCDCADDDDTCNLSCLVAVGRPLTDLMPDDADSPETTKPPPTRNMQFISRHATDGKFLFVDQRVTLALGFVPQELLGTSLYEYLSGPELAAVARTHKTSLLHNDSLQTPPYSFRKKDGTVARIQTQFKPFRNPWTKDVECLVANNTVIADYPQHLHSDPANPSFTLKYDETDDMQRLIDSQVESQKIGNAIAEEELRRSWPPFSPDLPQDLLLESGAIFNSQNTILDNILGLESGSYNQVRNNIVLNSAAPASPAPNSSNESVNETLGSDSPHESDDNGEAAMAVIMSLLEADAGLGTNSQNGTATFSGLPWNLP